MHNKKQHCHPGRSTGIQEYVEQLVHRLCPLSPAYRQAGCEGEGWGEVAAFDKRSR